MNNDGSQKSFSEKQFTHRGSIKKGHQRKSSDYIKGLDYNRPFVLNDSNLMLLSFYHSY